MRIHMENDDCPFETLNLTANLIDYVPIILKQLNRILGGGESDYFLL